MLTYVALLILIITVSNGSPLSNDHSTVLQNAQKSSGALGNKLPTTSP